MKKTWYEIYIDEINEKGSISNYVNDRRKNFCRNRMVYRKWKGSKKV